MSKRVTIRDVAKLADVSPMTVSRALKNDSNVKQTTKDKINKAAKELSYKLNFSARHLSGGKNYFIGLLCYQPNSSYVSQFLFGCMRYCGEVGYHLIVEESNGKENISETIALLAEGVDGVIVLPPLSENKQVLIELNKLSIPYVLIGQQIDTKSGAQDAAVAINDYLAALEMTEYIILQGHKKIGFISGDKKQQVSIFRYNGYKDALLKHGIEVDSDLVTEGDFTYKSALMAAEKLLSLKQRPSAIFACNDDMAAAVISMAYKHSLHVPEDISVVGFDDASTATMLWPQLTTVRQPLQDMAVKAIDRLLGNTQSAMIHLPFELVVRDSVSAPAKSFAK